MNASTPIKFHAICYFMIALLAILLANCGKKELPPEKQQPVTNEFDVRKVGDGLTKGAPLKQLEAKSITDDSSTPQEINGTVPEQATKEGKTNKDNLSQAPQKPELPESLAAFNDNSWFHEKVTKKEAEMWEMLTSKIPMVCPVKLSQNASAAGVRITEEPRLEGFKTSIQRKDLHLLQRSIGEKDDAPENSMISDLKEVAREIASMKAGNDPFYSHDESIKQVQSRLDSLESRISIFFNELGRNAQLARFKFTADTSKVDRNVFHVLWFTRPERPSETDLAKAEEVVGLAEAWGNGCPEWRSREPTEYDPYNKSHELRLSETMLIIARKPEIKILPGKNTISGAMPAKADYMMTPEDRTIYNALAAKVGTEINYYEQVQSRNQALTLWDKSPTHFIDYILKTPQQNLVKLFADFQRGEVTPDDFKTKARNLIEAADASVVTALLKF